MIDFRAASSAGVCVRMDILSSTRCEHDGSSSFLPSTSTTHILQEPVGLSPGIWQRVGMDIPFLRRTSSMVSPRCAVIFLPFTSMSRSMFSDQFIRIAENLHTSIHIPQPEHLSLLM